MLATPYNGFTAVSTNVLRTLDLMKIVVKVVGLEIYKDLLVISLSLCNLQDSCIEIVDYLRDQVMCQEAQEF